MAEKPEIIPELIPLKPKELVFANEFVITFNKTKSAMKAGYPKRSAGEAGCLLSKKPNIEKYIRDKLDELAMPAAEVKKRISDMGKSNLADYLSPRLVETVPRVERKVKILIKDLESQIAFEEEVFFSCDATEIETALYLEQQRNREKLLSRYKIMAKKNPQAKLIVNGKAQMSVMYDLDLAKIVKDREGGRIKSFAHTAHGIKIEMYSADDALEKLAKVRGLYEADNGQKTPTTDHPIVVNTYVSGPPLASSEGDIKE